MVSPTLTLIVQREAEIDAFKPELFYRVTLELLGFDAGSVRMKSKADAEALCQSCANQGAVVTKLENKRKAEKTPALYDLTTLQRDANRVLGFTAQQTLDYLQSLYEKKLCTYPRTDSRYLTSEMADSLPALVSGVAASLPKMADLPIHVNAAQVINDKKVSDHHAVIPTANFKGAALTGLPGGERAVLELVTLRLLCAVAQPHEYMEMSVTLECAGRGFSAKGRTVVNPGWRALMEAYHSDKSENESADAVTALPSLGEGQTFTGGHAAVKEGKTTPPKHYTEDTLLSAIEAAGAKEMPEDAERRGLGTPATRAAILEKLVSTGFVERKKSKKTVNLIPTHVGISLITVLPEQLQSPLMTAELKASLETINRTASGLITDIDRNYKALMKERGLDKEPGSIAAEPLQEITVQEPEPVSAPDNGCVPDPAISVESMNAYGYTDSNMLPLTKERALELMECDVTVYMLHTDNTEAMAIDADEVRSFDGIFGVETSECEMVKDRFAPQDYEKAFLNNPADSFAIY